MLKNTGPNNKKIFSMNNRRKDEKEKEKYKNTKKRKSYELS